MGRHPDEPDRRPPAQSAEGDGDQGDTGLSHDLFLGGVCAGGIPAMGLGGKGPRVYLPLVRRGEGERPKTCTEGGVMSKSSVPPSDRGGMEDETGAA